MQLSLHNGSASGVTVVSNVFLDYYMPRANGEFVKIYLYLLRLLGAGKDGRPLLRQMQRSGVPVLTKPADVGRIGPAAQELFTRECAWTDLYMLGMPSLRWSACGSDWKTTPILL